MNPKKLNPKKLKAEFAKEHRTDAKGITQLLAVFDVENFAKKEGIPLHEASNLLIDDSNYYVLQAMLNHLIEEGIVRSEDQNLFSTLDHIIKKRNWSSLL